MILIQLHNNFINNKYVVHRNKCYKNIRNWHQKYIEIIITIISWILIEDVKLNKIIGICIMLVEIKVEMD